MMTHSFGRLCAAVVLLMAVACGGADDQPPPAGALPADHPPISGPARAALAPSAGGVILETVDGGGYTYVRLGAGEQTIWVAGPITALAVGETISAVNPMAMGKFTSKALDRTFDNLFFADLFQRPGEAVPRTPPATPSDVAHGAGQGVVAETMDSGGYTYVRFAAQGKDVWIAGPPTLVKVGETVAWTGGTVMRDFTSNTLHRTFADILFVNSLSIVPGG